MQVLFVLNIEHLTRFHPKLGRDDNFYLKALPKLLCLPSLVSYIDIKEFVNASGLVFFEAFQLDPARSGPFHHDPARWHTFAATRFIRFLATASSQ